MGKVYVFFREHEGEEFFYSIELRDDEDVAENAMLNVGTIRVEDIMGNVVWSPPKPVVN